MLLRVRVSLPDRPGTLGQVARTLGVSGADVVQVVVLERHGARAIDDFTVVWPVARVDGLLAGLAAVPGVQVLGIWQAIGTPVPGGFDAELLGQVAANPTDGITTLVDALPALMAADWSAAVVVPDEWATESGGLPPTIAYASWQAPDDVTLPDIAPLRPRAFRGTDGTRYAAIPFGRAGLVLLAARRPSTGQEYAAPDFHASEIDRAAQLVRTAGVILGDRVEVARLT